MDTPIVNLTTGDLETVYEPSEDSFLLIDALEADLETLRAMKPFMCLEIGSGSGIVITALAVALSKYQSGYYAAIDINPNACTVTKRTGLKNYVDINVIQMDLLNCIDARCIFDIVIFNPPYVVTESSEIFDERLLSKAWAGGNNGREVMERIFSKIPQILASNGLFYLVVIKENDPQYILKCFEKLDMIGEIVAERKVRGELLYILRMKKCENRRTS